MLSITRKITTDSLFRNRLLSAVRNSRNSSSGKRSAIPIGNLSLLLIPVTTFGLGCWQIKRKTWKENLIKELAEKSSRSAIPLPDNLDDLSKLEYSAIKVRGQFLHDREIYLGPRSLIQNSTAVHSSLISFNSSGVGFLVITPFKLSDREEIILVNRGWVPKKFLNPETRKDGQISDEIEIEGVVRLGEKPSSYTSPAQRLFVTRDLALMCSLTGAEPIYIDAKHNSTIANGGPIGGQTIISLRNEHLTYSITWFGLSVSTFYIWYKKFVKKLPVM